MILLGSQLEFFPIDAHIIQQQMKGNSINSFREKSFRKFTFNSGDIVTLLPPAQKFFHNPFKTFELTPMPANSKISNESMRPKNYKSCEKIVKRSPQLLKHESEGCRESKPLKSCKSLSSTEHDDEIDFQDKKQIENKQHRLQQYSDPHHQKSLKNGQDSLGVKGAQQNNDSKKMSAILSLSKYSQKGKTKSMLSMLPTKLKSFKILRFKGKPEVFQIVKFVDRGSFGEVFLVRHVLTKMLLCLKSIKRCKLTEANFNQLVQQVKIQSSLNHPNIIKLYGYTGDADNIYILLEASLGQSLYKTMKSKPLVEAAVKEHVRKVCEAVEYLHDRHIIHRDIKSQNILLDNNTVKLCDFGWATHSSLLRSTKCGTPVYTPPQMVKMEQYGNKVDLWCIGVLTYELLFGILPFEIRFIQDFNKITDEQIKFPRSNAVSQSAKSFILNCLAKDPSERCNIKQALRHDFLTKKVGDAKSK